MRAPAVAAIGAWAALAVGACGGNAAPSKADYARNANRVCGQLKEQTTGATQGTPRTPQQIVAYADRLREVLAAGVRQVENVRRPAGADGDRAKAYSDALRSEVRTQLIPALEQLKAAARKRDGPAVQAAARRITAVDESKVDRLARAAGATGCAG